MQEFTLNLPTVILLLVILVLAALAIRRMARKGLCDCDEHCTGEGCHGCSGCSAAAHLVRAAEKAANDGSCRCGKSPGA